MNTEDENSLEARTGTDVEILTESREVEKILEELAGLVLNEGGWLHPRMQIKVEGSEISVVSDLERGTREVLMRVSETCMLTVDDFTLNIENDEFVIKDHAKDVATVQVQAMELMLALYNCTRKISIHKKTNPWFALMEAQDILDHFTEGKTMRGKTFKMYSLLQEKNWDRLALDSFFGTRTLDFKSGIYDRGGSVLIPFIDFLNHHFVSPCFVRVSYEKPGRDLLAVIHSKPDSDSNECFVNYNSADTMDAFITYGFVDTAVPYLRSVSMELRFPMLGTLTIRSRVSKPFKDKLGIKMEDMRFYLPWILKRQDGLAEVSYLLIPGPSAPMALRRALHFLLNRICPGKQPGELEGHVLDGERRIIEENLAYYLKLQDLTTRALKEARISPQTAGQLQLLVDTQLRKITEYTQRLSNS